MTGASLRLIQKMYLRAAYLIRPCITRPIADKMINTAKTPETSMLKFSVTTR